MIALCATHHRQADAGAISRDDLYRLKLAGPARAADIRERFYVSDWRDFTIILGETVSLRDCPTLIRIAGSPVLALFDHAGILYLYVHVEDENGRCLLHIEENDWIVNALDLWDCEVTANTIRVRNTTTDSHVSLKLDANARRALVRFRFESHGLYLEAGSSGFHGRDLHGPLEWNVGHLDISSLPCAFDYFTSDNGHWAMAVAKPHSSAQTAELASGDSRSVTLTIGDPRMSNEPLDMPNTAGYIPHVDEHFASQTLFVGGHEYRRCSFRKCTIVLSNTLAITTDCKFEDCLFRLEMDLSPTDTATIRNLRGLLDMISTAQSDSAP